MSDATPTVVLVEKAPRFTVKRALFLAAIVTTAVVSAKLARNDAVASKIGDVADTIKA